MCRQPNRPALIVGVLLLIAVLACSQGPVADGGVPVTQIGGVGGGGDDNQVIGVTPNAGSLEIAPFPTVPVSGSPTPDPARANVGDPTISYQVQEGDSLDSIALRAGVSIADIVALNDGLNEFTILSAGMILRLPAPASVSPNFKIIPNSELVYGPSTIGFDTIGFIQSRNSYLAAYTEEVDGRVRTGAELVDLVSKRYSVNPRLLLAVLEHQSGWVSLARPPEATLIYPMGHAAETWRAGLYHQLNWAANQLNYGYYLWRAGGLSTMILADGSIVTVEPTLNAGTVGVEYFFAQHYAGQAWWTQVGPGGLAATYRTMFGEPFSYTFDPILPAGLIQPDVSWPFGLQEGWYFTGGPHGSWDTGSGWGALDFAPPDYEGCGTSPAWVRAAAPGLIVRSGEGAVLQDLSGDGFEQTGWVLFYMHLATEDRAVEGMYAKPGDALGHPSCEGGFANARHLHFARKYNGEWIPADSSMPFNIGGWISTGFGSEYDGYLVKGDSKLEACDCRSDFNLIYFP